MLQLVRHAKCGKTWRQRGNLTGHCAKCCDTFEGLTLFDAHQMILADGRVECLDPATMTFHRQPLRLMDGTWRGPVMPHAVAENRRSLGNPGAIEAAMGTLGHSGTPQAPARSNVADSSQEKSPAATNSGAPIQRREPK
jgi:hypothetical protein